MVRLANFMPGWIYSLIALGRKSWSRAILEVGLRSSILFSSTLLYINQNSTAILSLLVLNPLMYSWALALILSISGFRTIFMTGGWYWPRTTGLLVIFTKKSLTLSLYLSLIFSLLSKLLRALLFLFRSYFSKDRLLLRN